jgi:hypothetical protein
MPTLWANGTLPMAHSSRKTLPQMSCETPPCTSEQPEKVFRGMIRGLGADPDDPRMIEGGNSRGTIPFGLNSLSLTETRAGNLLVLFLFLVALPLILLMRSPSRRDTAIFAIGLIGAFVFFCASLRWQPWNGRFHLPLFMLACAVVSVVLSEVCPQWIVALVAAIVIVGSVPFTLLNSPRPLLQIREAHRKVPAPSILRMGRDRMYFADQHLYLADSFLAAARFVTATGCRNVGLDASVQHYDYPMLALLKAGVGGPNVHYVGVHNRSTAFPASAGDPCAVVCLGCSLVHQKSTQYGGPSFFSTSFDRVEVFLRSGPSARKQQAVIASNSGHCGLLPPDQVQRLLGNPVSHTPNVNSCMYQGPAGRVLVRELPNGTDAPNFDDLAGEGMGSLPGGGEGYSTVIVFDGGWGDRPVLIYVAKNDRLFGINLDLTQDSARSEDFLRLANELHIDESAFGNTALH